METETEKTFMPEPGDYISAVIRSSDKDCKTYRGYVSRQAKGFSTSPWVLSPIVFDINGRLLPYVTDVAVMRNHEIVFSHNFDKLHYYRILLKSSDK